MIKSQQYTQNFWTNTILRGIDLTIQKGASSRHFRAIGFGQNHVFALPKRFGNARARHDFV